MRIFTRNTQRSQASSDGAARARQARHLDQLVAGIADSQARLIVIADRVAAGHAQPGDEARLSIQREITDSYRKRLEKIAVPTGVGDDAEAWLRSIAEPTELRRSDSR